MFHLLQIDPDNITAGSYLPVGLQVLIAVGLVVFLTVVTHLLGPKEEPQINFKTFQAE
jgi:NADH-quinone oxidoreductase subunit A